MVIFFFKKQLDCARALLALVVLSGLVPNPLVAGPFVDRTSETAVFEPESYSARRDDATPDPVRTIETLDVSTLEPGKHRFMFRAGTSNSGQGIFIPIHVMKGEKVGPRFMLVAGVHGDELNGIAVIHRIFGNLDTGKLSGTIVGIPGLNQPGLNANNRHFIGSDDGGFTTDLNRIFPGRHSTGDSAERYVSEIWNNVIKDNADFAVDLHTQTRGSVYPLFVFSDFGNGAARQMAFDLMPDVIKNDPGQRGTLETSLMASGIPAVTFEIGGPKSWQPEMINRAVTGLENVMVASGMIEGERIGADSAPFVGNTATNIFTDVGGYAYLHVGLKEQVLEGQHLATLKNAYGEEIKRYYAPVAGYVLSVATDPLREPGALLVRILN